MSSIPYDRLDNLIATSGLKWEDVVKCYSKNCKSIDINKQINLGAENLLYYIRAMSRIILDYEFQMWNKAHKDAPLKLIAAGSTNITSDYDVTIVGKDSSEFVELVLHKMSKLLKNKRQHLAEFADTNMYILPSVVNERDDLPHWLQFAVISDDGMKVPIPTSDIAKTIEKHYVKEFWNKGGSKLSLHKKYEKLIQKVKPLEKFYYEKETEMKESSFWHALFSANRYSIEAYLAMSSFLVVVVELQMRRRVPELDDHHYEIAAIENVIALKDHGLLDKKYNLKSSVTPKSFLKLSKYIQRIIYSLSNITELKANKSISEFVAKKSFVDDIVKQRGNVEFAKTEKMDDFISFVTTSLKSVITLLQERLHS